MGHTGWYICNFSAQAAVQLMLIWNTDIPFYYSFFYTSKNIAVVNISVAFYSNKHDINTIICPLAIAQWKSLQTVLFTYNSLSDPIYLLGWVQEINIHIKSK